MGQHLHRLVQGALILCLTLNCAVYAETSLLDSTQSENTQFTWGNPYTTIRVHKVGNVNLAVSNFGICGTQFDGWVDPETGLIAPSCQYPAGSSIEYLFQGPLWIGAIVAGDTLVSAAHDGWQHVYEMFAESYPQGDIEKRSTLPADPHYHPDAISEADYIAVYSDTLTDPAYVAQNPDDGRPHEPLGLQIHQESYSWSQEDYEDFVIIKYTLSNIGSEFLDDVFVGVYMDSDVYHINNPGGFTDDISGSLTTTDPIWNEELLIGWSADNDGDPSSGVWTEYSPKDVFGAALLDYPGSVEPNFNWWVSHGTAAQDWGPRLAVNDQDFGTGGLGTPTGDRNKYYVMATPERDYDQLWACVDFTSEGWLPPNYTMGPDLADETLLPAIAWISPSSSRWARIVTSVRLISVIFLIQMIRKPITTPSASMTSNRMSKLRSSFTNASRMSAARAL
jgi:hypothetical protein